MENHEPWDFGGACFEANCYNMLQHCNPPGEFWPGKQTGMNWEIHQQRGGGLNKTQWVLRQPKGSKKHVLAISGRGIDPRPVPRSYGLQQTLGLSIRAFYNKVSNIIKKLLLTTWKHGTSCIAHLCHKMPPFRSKTKQSDTVSTDQLTWAVFKTRNAISDCGCLRAGLP